MRIGCKINLSLRITGVRYDGWHELDTLFIPLGIPYDDLEIHFNTMGDGILVICDEAGIDPHNNTLTKAYTCFTEHTGYAPGMRVILQKGIPHGAGLGGGSADAAAILVRLNERLPEPLPHSELMSIAARIGADVPFFLCNRPCRARGIGDVLVPVSEPLLGGALQGGGLVLLCPSIRVSTPWAYRAWDIQNAATAPKSEISDARVLTETTDRAKDMPSRSLISGNIPAGSHGSSVFWLENSFEMPVFVAWPRLRELKEKLLQQGARAAVMSGSGAALVGFFRTSDAMQQFADGFRDQDVAVYCHAL